MNAMYETILKTMNHVYSERLLFNLSILSWFFTKLNHLSNTTGCLVLVRTGRYLANKLLAKIKREIQGFNFTYLLS